MAKKKFNEGFESIFGDEKSEKSRAGSGFLMGGETTELEAKPVEKRANSHKNFLTDLDFLLQEALHDNLDDYNRGSSSSSVSSGKTKAANAENTTQPRLAGIDSLIRQTIDIQSIEQDETGKKRVSFVLDRSKLEQLKTIARLEKTFLKDVVSKLIEEFVAEYSEKKGVDLK